MISGMEIYALMETALLWLVALFHRIRNWRVRRKKTPAVWYYIYRTYRCQEYRYKVSSLSRANAFFESLKSLSDYMDMTQVSEDNKREVLKAYSDPGASYFKVN